MADVPTRQWLCENIVQQIPNAIIFGDRENRIRLWNAGAEAMFGWSAQEALGQSMDLIIPEKHRARHWEGYSRVMKTGTTSYGHRVLAVPALTKDGRRISIEFNIAVLKDASGEVVGAAASIQDVTERWQRERALRERLADLEARLKHTAVGAAEKS